MVVADEVPYFGSLLSGKSAIVHWPSGNAGGVDIFS